jgi:F0F1-type ATP synthase membrane subunit b/b'|tara:strand:- start:509 stop:793 length:285 start_codon:yes stop_codon:yes gene_type:complete
MKNLEQYLEQAIQNINEDRDVTKSLLKDIMQVLASNDLEHEKVGAVAAKYVETLQRSNEQLVKIAALLQKRENGSESLSDNDKKELFDLIQGSD